MNSNRRKAWVFLAVTPITLFLGIVGAEWLYSSLGYEVGTTNAPYLIAVIFIAGLGFTNLLSLLGK